MDPDARSSSLPPPKSERITAILNGLADLRSRLGSDEALIAAIADESGLHPAALQPTLRAWTDSLRETDLRRLVASARSKSHGGRLLTLAPGNVPVVAAECLILGLLGGLHHQLALSTRARRLAEALAEALHAHWPGLDRDLELSVWRELPPRRRSELLAGSSRIAVYGTADTIEWVAAHKGARTRLVPHGPSLAAAYLEPSALGANALTEALAGLARDVATYDQRGCRSPHLLFVRADRTQQAERVAALLAEQLDAVQAALPRGRLTETEIADGFLDRLTSEALGSIIEGSHWRITLEDRARVIRPSPLGRTLRVVCIANPDDLPRLVSTLPAPVGCLALAPGAAPPPGLSASASEVAAMGTLQTPPFDRLHDGRHRLDELTGA